MLKLYNSLTRKVENFEPINPPHVGMYTCGPTVYDYMHIGNLRTFIMADVLRKTLEANNYDVKFVQNITDIEDKIIKKSQEKRISLQELTSEYTQLFFDDLNKLNIQPANVYPKATEHVGQMVKFIEDLITKGLAYVEKDGSVYFDISKFAGYGKLSQIDKRELKSGTRILSDEYTKENVQDFALWKAVQADEFGYDSPWGKGRPGWHIECSVMSEEYLGETFDIHAGGIDLLFPHHENEIAQSEGKSGKRFVNFFVHGEHLSVNGQKMSKSLQNIFTLKDLKDRGFEPLAYRYLVLTAHYRDKLNFTWESLQAAQNALNKIREEIRAWEQPKGEVGPFWQKFLEAANNDLNTPQAVAVMHELINSDTTTSGKSREILEMDKVLGLGLDQYLGKPLEVPAEVQKLLEQREEARKNQDFNRSDDLRNRIKQLGYEVEDTALGSKVKRTAH